MVEQLDVFYDGWGEHGVWGTRVPTGAISGRPQTEAFATVVR